MFSSSGPLFVFMKIVQQRQRHHRGDSSGGFLGATFVLKHCSELKASRVKLRRENLSGAAQQVTMERDSCRLSRPPAYKYESCFYV